MNTAAIVRGLTAAASARAGLVVGEVRDLIAQRAGADLRGVTAEVADDGVRLRGAGLVARAFGSRRKAADPRVAGLVAILTAGDPR